jgi:hypothetical protein
MILGILSYAHEASAVTVRKFTGTPRITVGNLRLRLRVSLYLQYPYFYLDFYGRLYCCVTLTNRPFCTICFLLLPILSELSEAVINDPKNMIVFLFGEEILFIVAHVAACRSFGVVICSYLWQRVVWRLSGLPTAVLGPACLLPPVVAGLKL